MESLSVLFTSVTSRYERNYNCMHNTQLSYIACQMLLYWLIFVICLMVTVLLSYIPDIAFNSCFIWKLALSTTKHCFVGFFNNALPDNDFNTTKHWNLYSCRFFPFYTWNIIFILAKIVNWRDNDNHKNYLIVYSYTFVTNER